MRKISPKTSKPAKPSAKALKAFAKLPAAEQAHYAERAAVTAKHDALLAEYAASVAPVAPAASEPAKPSARIARTAATIVRQATNFGGLSDRDNAYLAFYAGFAKAASDGIVTLAAIVESGRKPAYNGSAKPHDAGVIVRLTKANLIVPTGDGHSFRFTDKARTLAVYTQA